MGRAGKEYLEFILERLSILGGIRYRAMMGEYILYYQGKVIGGLYDNRLLVKVVSSVLSYVSNPNLEVPYQGVKPMLLVDDVDDEIFLTGLFQTMIAEVLTPRRRKR
ncbi:TfoX/Sxy family protein [Streptococcus ruminantium]|uniref:TfoX/Sxy family protein n=1 Tax=Streptococcus ruminantium TaxID=1917441 RepID=A0ABU1B2Y3_9STRE|nr:TfoX/Sxy family protein [Streptococcus ruminantium]MDQ8759451.1 TfoX/Sxy family protein [Streptococcus ruminantium]MDQ8768870.1 TfoX/Sxy family protein [Streptococcus ruminantium]MDQ8774833.1 TfoX/Sxy family protein [Streptococcus ruminantium]MDQ8793496.1 TfoX/Sxy family protein [Streptococcus ruminantium]MDQ8795993.1 TfoX/Sxy family protein [Streptococcus ruminantium]